MIELELSATLLDIVLSSGNDTDILIDMATTVNLIVITILAGKVALKYRTRTLAWFFLQYLSGALLFLMDQLSYLLMNPILLKVTYSVVISSVFLSLVMFESRTMRSSTSTPLLLLTAFIIIGVFYIAWDPAMNITVVGGDFVIDSVAFVFVDYGLSIVMFVMLLYWMLITYILAPQFVKKPALMMLVGGIMSCLASAFFSIVPAYLSIILEITGFALICLVIYQHPGIVCFLPYKAEYVIIMAKDGQIIFDQWWYKKPSGLHYEGENILGEEGKGAILTNAVAKIGSILEMTGQEHRVIDIEAGDHVYLVSNGSRWFNAGLIAKRSSMALQEGLKSFLQRVDELFEESNRAITQEFHDKIASMIMVELLHARAPGNIASRKAYPGVIQENA